MHGFLNVFVAACLVLAGKADVAVATQVLEDALATSFRFDANGLRYRELSLAVAEVTGARRFARSFGSCSFEEPIADLTSDRFGHPGRPSSTTFLSPRDLP
jgi:hypothetical protein